jgi:hypothetical protein
MPGVLKRTACGGANLAESVIQLACPPGRSRLLRAAWRPCSRGPSLAGAVVDGYPNPRRWRGSGEAPVNPDGGRPAPQTSLGSSTSYCPYHGRWHAAVRCLLASLDIATATRSAAGDEGTTRKLRTRRATVNKAGVRRARSTRILAPTSPYSGRGDRRQVSASRCYHHSGNDMANRLSSVRRESSCSKGSLVSKRFGCC